jgi:hypothetical protein
MKNTILTSLFLTFLNLPIFGQINNPFLRFWSGLFAPVYLTGTELEVTKVNPDTSAPVEKYKIPKGTYYSIVYEDDKIFYLKITSRLNPITPSVPGGVSFDALPSKNEYNKKNPTTTTKYKAYKSFKKVDDLFSITEPKRYNKIFKQGVTIGTLFLPIKLRPGLTITPEGSTVPVEYKREFSTDISIGPFLGYKYHVGEYYNQFLKFGVFAGPSLIKLTSKNLQNGQEGDTNVLGFSWGGGFAGEFKKFQAGFIVGWDYLSGESARNWVYDKKVWFSIGIGFNFFQDNDSSAK